MTTPGYSLADDPTPAAARRRAMILLTCTAVTFLYAMTVSIANVSLPQMQGALGATADQIAWVVTLNIVATAVVTPMAGWLTGRFGRRRLTLWCVVGFAFSSLLCGLAQSLEALVFYRALQGAFGAPLVPSSQAMILESYPKEKHGVATACFGVGAVLGPVVGPVAGGLLSEAFNWRYVFFMILPFTGLAFAGAWVYIHDAADNAKVRLDWTGFLSLALALAAFQFMLDRGERAQWFESYEIVAYAALAVLGLYIFIAHTATSKRPFLRPVLLTDRNFAIGLVIIFVFGMLNFTPMTLLPPLLQNIGGYPDAIIGFILGARGTGTSIAFFLMIWASRLNPKYLIFGGFLLQAWAGWAMAQVDINVGIWDLFWPIFWQGFGVGMLWVPITIVTFSTLRKEWVAEGTAVYHLLRNIGGSIHISISISLAIRMMRTNYAELSENVSPFNEVFNFPWVTGRYAADSAGAVAGINAEVSKQAMMLGYIDAFMFFVWTCLIVLPLVFLIKTPKRN